MADTTGNPTTHAPSTPVPRKASWRHIGPGVVVAATGVGAGDLVATLIAGSNFGYTLLWAAVIGCLVKISLAEAAGRWHLSTGRTLFDGWASLGRWTLWFFGVYAVIWGFVYGAAAMSSSALPLQALFPDVMDLKWWAVACGLSGLVFVWFNKYAVFEKVMTVLVGVMFVVTVYLAIRVTPNIPDAVAGLLPVLPEEKDSVLNTLGLIGGVGGTITLAAYGYWVNAKGWTDSGWMKVMRLDNRVAYVTTGIFVVAMLFVGAELLHSANVAIASGDKGLVQLSDILEAEYGSATAKFFLIGFFATSFTSLIGVWHGVSLMFADFVSRVRGAGDSTAEDIASGVRERSWPFRAYLLWLTFPPIVLLFQGQPFRLIILYGVLGAAFLPFLALTLIWLLNSRRTPAEWRNGWLSNGMLVVAGVLFVVLCAKQVWDQPWSEFF
ncbi:Nramp family divalent metal transporter [Streptomyces acidiscabies]|uniref:Nramp family divalent metal transporter n=1 Tax=Streptomyces acidiscabies TaxID=42234 RepID=A0AAP6EL12_9ACTN|nr:Nramp family divalent metal transporter [Streptomyces acidiscabies]MBZ3914706.1 Nramp family divalent metal transporter [Streptomyces acidiscabies]MDX2966141.1 Nramp family divalent metal transporter [Streptomyces acidiscabies]MDX3020620.1 Nramp family divalent metal transporter [Streptomyces acidiscabies]MDX3795827.1 Nramp family divalent metal transporter [Streptomyces acidiscabies]GAV41807.1 divalent metal cation transporter MntH [Streptomyces acidiscabies]